MNAIEATIFLGLDVGKEEHHATAIDAWGNKLHDKPLPQDEKSLRAVYEKLQAKGRLLVVVDQPASIGALAIAVARSMDIDVAYLPGLAMRRIADLHPGSAKTDARDAMIIAEAARTMPNSLRRVDTGDEALTSLKMLTGYDDDLRGEATRVKNQLRNLLLSIHPALERVVGPRLEATGVLDTLIKHDGPKGLRKARVATLAKTMKPGSPRLSATLPEQIKTALTEQTVSVPGSDSAEIIIPRLAQKLKNTLAERKTLEQHLEEKLCQHPLSVVLISMPGVAVRTASNILCEIGSIKDFATPGHLASYAGLAPVTRRSGSSIRGEHPNRGGNHRLKNALFLSAFAALRSDPVSRAYYDKKRAEGKKHNAALICLARRRCDVLYAMLRDGTLYQPPAPQPIPEAA